MINYQLSTKFNYSFLKIFIISFCLSFIIRSIIFIYLNLFVRLPDEENYIIESIKFLSNHDFYSLFNISMPLYSILLTIPISIYIFIDPILTFDNIILFSNILLESSDLDNVFFKKIRLYIFIFNNLLASVQPFLLFFLTYKIFKNYYVSLIAGFIFIFYPITIFYSINILTENIFLLFLLLGLISLYSRLVFLSSIFFVLSILIRPTFEMAYPLLILIFTFMNYDKILKMSLYHMTAYFFIYIILLLPWWNFNYTKYDQFVRLHPNLGFLLYAGNNPLNKTGGGIINEDFNFDGYDSFLEIENNILNLYPCNTHISDIDDNKFRISFNDLLMKDTLNFIFDNKILFIQNSFKKFLRLYNIIPNTDNISFLIKVIYSFSYVPILILSLISFCFLTKRDFYKLMPLFFLIIFFTAVHTITISSVRYRYSIEFIMIILSSISCYNLIIRYYKR